MTRASDTAKLLGAGTTILDGITITTADNTAQLTLSSTDSDATSGPQLTLKRDSSSPADNDFVGRIKYIADNDASQEVAYVDLLGRIIDASDGTEDASLFIKVMNNGSDLSTFSITPTEVVINDDSADIDFRVESNGDANCLFIDGGNNVVGINNNVMSSMSTDGNNLVVGSGSGNEGITIFSATDGTGNVYFADGSSGGTRYRGWLEYGHASDYLAFGTAGAERFRFNNNGTSCFGATNNDALLGLESNASSVPSLFINSTTSGTGANIIARFRRGGTNVGAISITGNSATFVTSSDYRLKENVSYSFDATTRLKQLKPARFNFISDADTTLDGFLAHEVSSIVPEAISGEKDATEDRADVVLNADGTFNSSGISEADWTEGKSNEKYASDTTWVASKTMPDYQGIDQSKLVPLLVKTVQELEARITALES